MMGSRSRLGNRLRFLSAALSRISAQVVEQLFEAYVLAANDCRFSAGDRLEFAGLWIDDRDSAGAGSDVLPDCLAQRLRRVRLSRSHARSKSETSSICQTV